MIDIFSLVGAGSTLAMVGLCIKLAKNNGKSYIKKDACHNSMDSINTRIEDLKDHIDTRVDDVCSKVDIIKDFILKK